MFRIIAISLNILFLVLFVWISIEEGTPIDEGIEFLFLWLLLIATPLFNLCYIFLANSKDNWFSLFLKRKALEEKKKIEELLNKK